MNLQNLLFFLFLFASFFTQAQVGINTTDPKADLDVNGTFRVGELSGENLQARKLLGVNEDGIILELEMDENIYIDGSKVKSHTRREGVYEHNLLGIPLIDNALSIIWPGGTGDGKSVIRIDNLIVPNTTLTGLEMNVFTTPTDAHGMTVTLYSVSGTITLKSDDAGSSPENRFRLAAGLDVIIQQYEMVRVMYDAILEKWLVMSRN